MQVHRFLSTKFTKSKSVRLEQRKGEKDMKLYKIDTNLEYKEYWCEDLEIIEEDIEDLQRQKEEDSYIDVWYVDTRDKGVQKDVENNFDNVLKMYASYEYYDKQWLQA